MIVGPTIVCGVGFGLFNSPNNRTIMAAAPRSRSGGASGMQATSRLLGQTVGSALVAMLFNLFPAGGTPLVLTVAAVFSALAGIPACSGRARSCSLPPTERGLPCDASTCV